MAVHHNGRIRTDWLPLSLSYGKAKVFAEKLTTALKAEGAFGGHESRSFNDKDRVAVTRPGGGRATVKVRGCDGFRSRAYEVARALAASEEIRFGSHAAGNPSAEMSPNEIDFKLIEARKNGRPVLVYCGSPAYVRGVPGEVERVDDWTKMTSTVVLNIGMRKIPLLTITKVTEG